MKGLPHLNGEFGLLGGVELLDALVHRGQQLLLVHPGGIDFFLAVAGAGQVEPELPPEFLPQPVEVPADLGLGGDLGIAASRSPLDLFGPTAVTSPAAPSWTAPAGVAEPNAVAVCCRSKDHFLPASLM